MRRYSCFVSAAPVLIAGVLACAAHHAPAGNTAVDHPADPTLTPQHSGTTSRLQAISPVSALIAWASGTGGTYAVTTDGGATWRAGVVPGADSLEFRDVQGVDARTAYLLSAGNGDLSRIYKTSDGGASWTRQFTSQDSSAFYDCFAFWSPSRGIAMSDGVKGRFPAIRTVDGSSWEDIGGRLPAALQGEGAFAASGTCVAVQGDKRAWIATGAGTSARILATTDGGNTWEPHAIPIVQGTSTSGAFSVAFGDAQHGILGGGELSAPTTPARNIARSSDGGRTWAPATGTSFPGAVFGLTYVRGMDRPTVVATGPSGAAWSPDEGDHWLTLAGVENYWAVAFASPTAGWLVGTEGRILKLSF
ncbi:MAG TPA: hypothetical protein VJQ44_00440 [Gemmatimonadales bacterium]|nr:hypothetical protein [Gemmatimonadales bacterium]